MSINREDLDSAKARKGYDSRGTPRFRWRARRDDAGRARRRRNRTKTYEKDRRKSNPWPEKGGLLREGQPSGSPRSEVRSDGRKSRQGHK